MKKNYSCYNKQEKLGSAGELDFAVCMFKFISKKDSGEKSYCLSDEGFFPPTCIFKEKKI